MDYVILLPALALDATPIERLQRNLNAYGTAGINAGGAGVYAVITIEIGPVALMRHERTGRRWSRRTYLFRHYLSENRLLNCTLGGIRGSGFNIFNRRLFLYRRGSSLLKQRSDDRMLPWG